MHKIETGWLIEHEIEGALHYMTIKDEVVDWTPDSLQAIRFARRVDAEKFAHGLDCDRIAEHQWG